MEILILIFGIFSILFQFASVYLGYKIYTFNRIRKWWLALVFAFLIQGVKRIIVTYQDYFISGISSIILVDRVLQLLISLLIFIGLWSMFKNFENFEIIEKKVKAKIKKH